MADSLRKSSVSSYSNKSYQRIHKFKFTNLSLSYQIRRQVYEILISFDDNRNFELEKEEITRALVEILDESQEELAYITRNVYRYDTNQDGIITYEEFVLIRLFRPTSALSSTSEKWRSKGSTGKGPTSGAATGS